MTSLFNAAEVGSVRAISWRVAGQGERIPIDCRAVTALDPKVKKVYQAPSLSLRLE
jgi:hypothetical protein